VQQRSWKGKTLQTKERPPPTKVEKQKAVALKADRKKVLGAVTPLEKTKSPEFTLEGEYEFRRFYFQSVL